MENILEEDQDKIMGAVGSETVHNFLQKYKVQNSFFPSIPKEFISCNIQVKPQRCFKCLSDKKFMNSLQLSAFQVFCCFLFHVTVLSCLICISKGFRIDLTCKQLTVDFVNQSVLQISSHDVEGKRSDKTDFAEKLGAMNRRWQILQGLISEKVIF